jgi:two-component system response regulator AlgR
LLLDESLRDIEQEFGSRFLRIHRNALAATAYVTGMQRLAGGESVLCLAGVPQRPQISRRHLGEVRAALERL